MIFNTDIKLPFSPLKEMDKVKLKWIKCMLLLLIGLMLCIITVKVKLLFHGKTEVSLDIETEKRVFQQTADLIYEKAMQRSIKNKP